MKNKLVLLSLIVGSISCLSNNVFAQKVAGYLGKRGIVGATVLYMPNIYGLFNGAASSINSKGESQFYMFNPPQVGVSLGYVTSNIRTMVLDATFQQVGVYGKNDIDSYGLGNADFSYSKSSMFNLKLRFQKAFQHCAPAGSYRGLTLGFTQFNNAYLNNNKEEIDAGSAIDFSIGYAGGFRRIYKDKYVIDLSLEYNLPILMFGKLIESEDYYSPEEIKLSTARAALIRHGLNNILVTRAAFYILL
ncbi:MAG: hypothetical protein MH472_07110 [Bacteroidia bacterium]|nr:hypothetical protein [Bacteroidia bacterium]